MTQFSIYRSGIKWLRVSLILAFGLVAGLIPSQIEAQAIHKVYVTDVREGSFVVSWTTDTATTGHVDYGTTTALGSTASDTVSTTTHYVIVSGLSPGTTYFLQVRSGASTDDNGGSMYSVTTGSVLSSPPPSNRTIHGTVFEAGGSTAIPHAIVYLFIADDGSIPTGVTGASQVGSARADENGVWSYTLSNLRTSDFSASYAVNDAAQDLALIGQGGSAGTRGEIGTLNNMSFPVQVNGNVYSSSAENPVPASGTPTQIDIIMDAGPTAVTLMNFSGQSMAGLRLGYTNLGVGPYWPGRVFAAGSLLTAFATAIGFLSKKRKNESSEKVIQHIR